MMALFCAPGAPTRRLNLARTVAKTSSTWLLHKAHYFMVTSGSKGECCKRQDVEQLVSSGLGSETGTAKLSPNSHGPRSHRAQPSSRERKILPSRQKNYQTFLAIF